MNNSTYQQLIQHIREIKQAAVAFSGGVDSSFLAYAAHQALGDKMVAITVNTPYIPTWEIAEAREFARQQQIVHHILELPIPPAITQNPPERCYLCKKEIFQAIQRFAANFGIKTIIEGSNQDDLADYRPGMRALKELQIRSPLLELGITKETIRTLSRQEGLSTWNKPAYACLLSRIPYHTEITAAELARIARAEQILRQLNLTGARVRSHGDIARIEVEVARFEEFMDADFRQQLVEKINQCGYTYVTLDLDGYQTGSLNKTLTADKTP